MRPATLRSLVLVLVLVPVLVLPSAAALGGCSAPDPDVPGCGADDADCDGVLADQDCDDHDEAVGEAFAGTGCMLRIEAQDFDMGCTKEQVACLPNELPVTPVTLTHGTYLSETEVTEAEYRSLMGDTLDRAPACDGDCPQTRMSWHEAALFANTVSDAAGLERCYSCSGTGWQAHCTVAVSPRACGGYRLPTEAEWEAAARCGEVRRYAGSDQLDAVGWHFANSGEALHPVAQKDPNACGLFDLTGNAAEWTQDGYGETYSETRQVNPVGNPGTHLVVVRGGSAFDTDPLLKLAFRGLSDRSFGSLGLGIRLARTAP